MFFASKILAIASSLVALAVLGGGCQSRPPTTAGARSAAVERGRFLVTVGGCNDCHTPMKFDAYVGMPLPDTTRVLAGHPSGGPDPGSTLSGDDAAVIGASFTSFKAPFGIVYAANLTPDEATGLGAWTEEMFIAALRTGRHMGGKGRPIIPPMPWPTLAQLSDVDLRAIWSYLRTLVPVRNDVPAPRVPDEALDAIAASYDKLAARLRAEGAPATAPPTVARR